MSNEIIWEFSKGGLTAYPEPNVFDLNSSEEEFNNLINLDNTTENNIFQILEAVSDRLVDGAIPFGRDSGGNLICFDYRTNEVPIK